MTKLAYQTPAIREHGSVEALTKTTQNGTFLDAAFDQDTPLTEITIS
ncbi:MAG: lasso RiPP family leader peptide-containing protein [Pseudomonadota bacterium]